MGRIAVYDNNKEYILPGLPYMVNYYFHFLRLNKNAIINFLSR